jgi:hypothetical protein
MFNDLPVAESLLWANDMALHSAATFGGELTFPGWKYVDVSWLRTGNDRCVPTSIQDKAIAMINSELAAEGRKVQAFQRFFNHMPHMTNPEWIVDVVKSVLKEN